MTQPEDQATYRVGDLTDPRDHDPFITGWDAAMKEAERQYNAADDLGNAPPIGIWLWEDDGDASLDGIYYEGWVFTP